MADNWPAITAVLSLWKRPHLILDQVQALRDQTRPPAEIWVWADSCAENLDYQYRAIPADRVFRNTTNLGVYGRFAISLLARTPLIFIVDDDTFPGTEYLENAARLLDERDAIVVAAGVQLTGPFYKPSVRYGWPSGTPRATRVDSGCQSWLVRNSWLSYLWREPVLDWHNGEDLQFSYLAQKYGGIDTYTPPQATAEASGSTKGFLGWDCVAVSSREDHYEVRSQQVRRQLSGGWRTVRGVGP